MGITINDKSKSSLKERVKLIILIGMMSFSLCPMLRATTGAEFLRQESSPNASVLMGGSALEQGSSAIVVNPAGMLGQSETSLSFTHFASFVETAYQQLEIGYPLGEKMVIGGRLFYDSAYNLTEINELGEAVDNVTNYDVIVHPAVAMSVMENLSLGLGLKLFQSVLDDYHSMGAAVDLGLQYKLKSLPVALSFVMQNLGFMTAYDQAADNLPISMSVGAAFKWAAHAHQLILLADLSTAIEENLIMTPLVGLQYQYHHNAFVKVAYRLDEELGNLMIGAGVKWGVLGFDYSYQPYGALGDNHRVTLSYYFKKASLHKERKEIQIKSLNAKPIPKTKVPKLTVLPRIYSAKISILPTVDDQPVEKWSIQIVNKQNDLIREFSGANKIPKVINWDGTDQQGQQVSDSSDFKIKMTVNNKTPEVYQLPKCAPAVSITAPIKRELNVPVMLKFEELKKINTWEVLIVDAAQNSPQAVYSGKKQLPRQIKWAHAINPADQKKYDYQLKINYSPAMSVVVKEAINMITAETVPAPDDYEGIKVTGILFDFDSAQIKPQIADKVQAVAQLLSTYPDAIYTVCEGHADAVGTEAYNQDLSEKRAHMVANKLLIDTGASEDYVSMKGYGKTQPMSKLKTEAGKAQNRRVEIILFIPNDLN